MKNIAYIGLSQQIALQQQMDIVSGNIANMGTTGFQARSVLFGDYVDEGKKTEDQVHQAYNFKTYRDLSAGSLKQTFNPLDVAIQGNGYFAVQGANGTTTYTKDGAFMMDADGQIVTQSGRPVMGDGGSITIPENAGPVTITPDGTVSTKDGAIGKLKVTTFDDEQKLVQAGDNEFQLGTAREKEIDTDKVKVVQGSLEAANVNPVVEMTRMTQIMRAFETAQNTQQNDHDLQRKMIETLTRTA